MPRIYKGTETILKLYVHQCEVGDINTLRIALFTDTVDNSVEFYSDNMTIDGDTVFLRVNAWSFDMMNDGVINYIAHIESGEETFITERQSNYFLKTPTAYEPTITPNMDNYYTKGEVDELLENVEGGESDVTKEYVDKQDADLWNHLKLTEDRYIGVRSGDSSYGSAIKDGNIIFNFTTINGESILGTKDIIIQGGEGGSATGKIYEYGGDWTVEDVYNDYLQGIPVFIKKNNQYGTITDVSNANGQIRLNGLFGDASGDAKPLRFECSGPRSFATWQMAFQESITSLSSRISNLENNGGGGSTSDPDSYIIYLPEDYSEDTYTFDGEFVNSESHGYYGSDRMEHNAQVIQAINEGKVKSVYLQRIREYFQVEDYDSGTYTLTPIFMYVPMQFRQKNEIVDDNTRIFGYYAPSEDDNNQIYLVGYNFNDDGTAYITIDRPYEIENGGGSGGGDYGSNPTFDSITVNGGAYFNSEIVMAGGGQSGESDIASMIACAFKAGKTQSIDQWARNIHCGTDGQGLRVCSSDEGGETQYMAVDTDGNIYEGETKLSDKYVLKTDYDALLARVEALENN